MLSKTNQYAIRSALYVAENQGDGPVRANDIATSLALPPNYLSKILHALARAGILSSERGPRGGFRLARPAAAISLADVMEPFYPLTGESGCVMGCEECSDASPCRLHEGWKKASRGMLDLFRDTVLADLLEKVER